MHHWDPGLQAPCNCKASLCRTNINGFSMGNVPKCGVFEFQGKIGYKWLCIVPKLTANHEPQCVYCARSSTLG